MTSAKLHLTPDEQLQLLVSRGMRCPSDEEAVATLRRVGYYRLSAYWYPFREMLPEGQPKESPQQHRSDEFVTGASFDHVTKLYAFDRKLKLVCLDGLETLEVGLRVQTGHVLGRRDTFAHLQREYLNGSACSTPSKSGTGDAYSDWRARYEKLKTDARSEDFVAHHAAKYEGLLPVWVATEILDFGCLTRLFSLMLREDQNAIARSLGVHDGILLHKWLVALNHLRNVCAHHSRLWNKKLAYPISRIPQGMVGPDLKHLRGLEARDRLYAKAALLAYLTRHIHARTTWPSSFRTQMKKFPAVDGILSETAMGCPPGWLDEYSWAYPVGAP